MKRHVAAGVMLAGVGLIWGSAAQADQTGWYFGLGGGLTTVDVSKSDFDSDFVDILSQAALQGTGSLPDSVAVASTLDDSDKSWNITVGYRFNRWVAAEAGYVDLGKFVYANEVGLDVLGDTFVFDSDLRIRSNGPFAAVLGMFPINDKFDVHVRGGLYFSDTRVRQRTVSVDPDVPESFISVEVSDSEHDFFAGIGATWNINESYSLRLEYQRYLDVGGDRTGESDIDLINVGLLFR